MKKLYFIGLLLISQSISGQNNYLGVKAGTRTTWFTGSEFPYINISESFKSRTFATGGLAFETLLNRRFMFGVELLYEPSGYISETEIDHQSNDPLHTVVNKYYFGQLSVPVLLGVHFGEDFYGNVHVGLTPALIFVAKRDEENFDQGGLLLSSQSVIMEPNNAFDINYLAGGNIGYKINNRTKLQATLRYQGNFSKHVMQSNIYWEDYKYNGLSFTAGYFYALTPVQTVLIDPNAVNLFLEKSKVQKKAGITLMVSGAVLAIAGGLYQRSHDKNSTGFLDFDFTGATIAVAGGVLFTTGVVFLIRSDANQKKATGVNPGF